QRSSADIEEVSGIGQRLELEHTVHHADQRNEIVDRRIALLGRKLCVYAPPFRLVDDRVLRLLARMMEEDVLPELGRFRIRRDALAIVSEHEDLDMAGEREDGPRRFRKDCARDIVGVRQERVSGGHPGRAQALDAAEKLLMLDLLVAEAHERLERMLVAEAVVGTRRENLGGDEALDESEQVGVGAPLNLAQQASFVGRQTIETIDARQTVRQELAREIERTTANHVAVDVEANAPGVRDTLSVAIRDA